MTTNQIQLADSLDEMEVGQTIEFTSGDFVKRESPTRYVLNDERDRLCFVQAYDRLKGAFA